MSRGPGPWASRKAVLADDEFDLSIYFDWPHAVKSTQGEGKARMSQEELRGQLTTFLLAGHETTSTATTWTLLALARDHGTQTKLRTELREARRKARGEGRDELDSRELDALPYLDAVCVSTLLPPSTTSPPSAAARTDLAPVFWCFPQTRPA